MKILRSIVFIILVVFSLTLRAQLIGDRYVNAKLGQGVLYGGRGIHIEYRYKHVGIGLDGGYQSEQYIYEHTVKPSYNAGFNARYYYFHKNGSWQAYGGFYFGWLSNYYLPLIGEEKYNPMVYGAAPIIGIEIREEILNVDLGLSLDPGVLILQKSQHPHYGDQWNISPNIGIGVNLYALRSAIKFRKKIKNKEWSAKPIHYQKTDSILPKLDKNIHDLLIEQKAANIIENCNQSAMFVNEKAFYANDTLFLLKQVGLKQYIYIKFYLPEANKEQFYSAGLNSLVQVYYINQKLNIQSTDELPTILEDCENSVSALKGLFNIYIKNKSCSATLDQLMFKDASGSVFFDSISFCKLSF
jgi:hypothetical protein